MATTNPLDEPAIATSLERVLGHSPPFSDAECGKLERLTLEGATRLDALEKFKGLRELNLHGCALTGLEPVTRLERITTLRIVACPVADLTPLTQLKHLAELAVDFGFVEDLKPLLNLGAIHRIRLLGCPLSVESYDVVAPQLLGRASPSTGRPPVLQLSRRSEWQVQLKLWERGVRLCFSSVDRFLPILVEPGLSWTRASYASQGGIAQSVERPDASTASLARAWLKADRHVRPGALISQREVGDAEDAMGWVKGSDLPNEDQESLARFIRAFGSLTFYRDLDRFLAEEANIAEVELPSWFRSVRKTLAFVLPGEPLRVRLGRFDQAGSRRSDLVTGFAFRFSGAGYDDPEREEYIRGSGLFPLAQEDELQSSLAIRLSESDSQIYEYNEEFLVSEVRRARKRADDQARLPADVAFGSYASMLANVVTIEREGGETVHARR
jgi:hypothetical protein